MKSVLVVICAVAILVHILTKEAETVTQPERFRMEHHGGSFKVVYDRVTGCQFLYIGAYKMSGLSLIPGTCKGESP